MHYVGAHEHECSERLGEKAFIKTFGNEVEKYALCAAAVYCQKSFASFDDLYHQFCAFIDALPAIGKEGILRRFSDVRARGNIILGISARTIERRHEIPRPEGRGTSERLQSKIPSQVWFSVRYLCTIEQQGDHLEWSLDEAEQREVGRTRNWHCGS